MDRKERESLVIALSEKGKLYREIVEKLRMSPNTIKAIGCRLETSGFVIPLPTVECIMWDQN